MMYSGRATVLRNAKSSAPFSKGRGTLVAPHGLGINVAMSSTCLVKSTYSGTSCDKTLGMASGVEILGEKWNTTISACSPLGQALLCTAAYAWFAFGRKENQ